LRLDRNDHHIVENFLATRPAHVGGIIVEASNLDRQAFAIEAAKAAGIDVVVETLTERLAHPGLDRSGLEYFHGQPHGPANLATNSDKNEFVKRVVATQLDCATVVVAPHFYADDAATLDLNVELVSKTAEVLGGRGLRAVLTAPRAVFAERDPRLVAKRYRIAGASHIDLRLSPLGGHDNGARKIQSALDIAAAFRDAPLVVTLGLQGQVGQPAVALGAADRYSVGIGYREQLNFKSMISSQRRDPNLDAEFASPIGILLPGPDITVRRSLGKTLLADTRLRGRLEVHTELLADPSADPRGPYLVSRQEQVSALMKRPKTWRVQHELARLTRAIKLREIINDYHLPPDAKPLKTRTLKSLQIVCNRYLDDD